MICFDDPLRWELCFQKDLCGILNAAYYYDISSKIVGVSADSQGGL